MSLRRRFPEWWSRGKKPERREEWEEERRQRRDREEAKGNGKEKRKENRRRPFWSDPGEGEESLKEVNWRGGTGF